jgi:glyoxylase-like metal-dependent hydrolase (beta-lactamase superfamily II)
MEMNWLNDPSTDPYGGNQDPMCEQARLHRFSEHLHLIELRPPIKGFESFIGTWLFTGKRSWIVDVGPAVTAKRLTDALKCLGTTALDYILLTHIHIDHAGAIGHIAEAFPQTPIICPPAGVPHLIDPKRLWEGSLKTLGATGRAYGPIQAVAPERLLPADELQCEDIISIATPGHSPHHYSYLCGAYLFAGEAGGVYLNTGSGDGYLRPATPPRFLLETSLRSIDILLEHDPQFICYGHFGMSADGDRMLIRHRDQLQHWNKILSTQLSRSKVNTLIGVGQLLDLLLRRDSNLQGFEGMDAPTRRREEVFLTNSIRGYLGYLNQK